jgi:hypothetical protein
MRTSEATGFGFGLAKWSGMAKIGLSSDTDDVSETVLVDVLDGGSMFVVVVVVVVWGFETTASVVVSEAICEVCWGISETIYSVIILEVVSIVWIDICFGRQLFCLLPSTCTIRQRTSGMRKATNNSPFINGNSNYFSMALSISDEGLMVVIKSSQRLYLH